MIGISGLRRLAGKVAAAFRELDEVQRQALALRTAPDQYLRDPGQAPDSYAEFLMRTSGALLREPSARARERRARERRARERCARERRARGTRVR